MPQAFSPACFVIIDAWNDSMISMSRSPSWKLSGCPSRLQDEEKRLAALAAEYEAQEEAEALYLEEVEARLINS